MSREAVAEICPLEFRVLVMTSPGSLDEGNRVVIDGLPVSVSFGSDGTVNRITTNSADYRLDGDIGVGSSLAEIEKAYPGCEASAIFGMGRYVRVTDTVTLGFEWESEEGGFEAGRHIEPDDRAAWLDLRSLPVTRCTAQPESE